MHLRPTGRYIASTSRPPPPSRRRPRRQSFRRPPGLRRYVHKPHSLAMTGAPRYMTTTMVPPLHAPQAPSMQPTAIAPTARPTSVRARAALTRNDWRTHYAPLRAHRPHLSNRPPRRLSRRPLRLQWLVDEPCPSSSAASSTVSAWPGALLTTRARNTTPISLPISAHAASHRTGAGPFGLLTARGDVKIPRIGRGPVNLL